MGNSGWSRIANKSQPNGSLVKFGKTPAGGLYGDRIKYDSSTDNNPMLSSKQAIWKNTRYQAANMSGTDKDTQWQYWEGQIEDSREQFNKYGIHSLQGRALNEHVKASVYQVRLLESRENFTPPRSKNKTRESNTPEYADKEYKLVRKPRNINQPAKPKSKKTKK